MEIEVVAQQDAFTMGSEKRGELTLVGVHDFLNAVPEEINGILGE
jgi:hypothetical protein